MAISLKRTGTIGTSSVKMIGYGPAKVGKTRAIATLPNPITLSCEGGLLVLREQNLPYIEVGSLADLYEAYEWLTSSDEAKQYESVALDSITEMGEVVLAAEKKVTINGKLRDPRQAYGAMQDLMGDVIRAFRDLPDRHVYFCAQMEKSTDELGSVLYAPAMPGQKFPQKIPYFFDEVLAFRIENKHHAILTATDGVWVAGDRSGKLDTWEPQDLGAIIRKIQGDV
jgi:hypothetical protein